MNTFGIALPAIVLACGLAGPASAQQFGYACETCSTSWGVLSEGFEACRVGEEQSPIDISEPTRRRLAPVRFDYGKGALLSIDRAVNIDSSWRIKPKSVSGRSGSTRCSFTSTA
jgi:carbonic anhydrase